MHACNALYNLIKCISAVDLMTTSFQIEGMVNVPWDTRKYFSYTLLYDAFNNSLISINIYHIFEEKKTISLYSASISKNYANISRTVSQWVFIAETWPNEEF